MDPTTLPPISGEAIGILLLQLAGVLALARILSEVMRRLRQPAVIGELLAGIVLGPTVLGHWVPRLEAAVFPPTVRQFHLLEAISWIGMVLLLLLTGLETDIRVMRSLGRAALYASLGGMLVNFTVGGTLGALLPARYLVSPATRPVFAAFLATALAITAMPVVAKILIDLGLLRRNIGVVILSAGVLDDTTGWLVLSVIAGLAGEGAFSAARLGLTLVGLVVYLAAMRWVVYPVISWLLRRINERGHLAGADVTVILVATFLSAAATQAIGVHAVFGAFAMGLLVRQVPRVRAASLEAIETFVLAALSPVFFAFVGLKVNLWSLTGWRLPVLVIALAIAGKMIGCYVGARQGGLSRWEALAVGSGMNARGAMGLIVALLGLSLGLLSSEMYSVIVLVAVATSFLAPRMLRLIIPHLPMTEEERRRVVDDTRERLLPTGPLRILAPTAGGPNAAAMLAVAAPLVRASEGSIVALFVDTERRHRLREWLHGRRAPLAGRGLDEHLTRAAERFGAERRRFATKRIRSDDVAGAVLVEAARDYDMLMLGAAPRHVTAAATTSRMLAEARLPAVVVRAGAGPVPDTFARLLVPLDGSIFSHAAAEFAFTYARATGASVTLLHVLEATLVAAGSLAMSESHEARAVPRAEEAPLEARIRAEYDPLAAVGGITYDVRLLATGDPVSTIVDAATTGDVDLLVLGAESKLLTQSLGFGRGTASIVDRVDCATAVVVPWLR